MGTSKWNHTPLFSGYRVFISGKEVELVDEVNAAQMPHITGTEDPDESVLEDEDWEVAVSRVSIIATPRKTSELPEVTSTVSSAKKFVPPTGFYGAPSATIKKKPDGPL
jgi:DNA repair and recombination protein RAD54B